MDATDNPYGVTPGSRWFDRRGVELLVERLEFHKTKRHPKGYWSAVCTRAGTGIIVYPALASFSNHKGHGYHKEAPACH